MTDAVTLPAPSPAPNSQIASFEKFFNSARGHALVAGLLATAALVFPSWAPILNQAAITFGYGAVVAGAPAAK